MSPDDTKPAAPAATSRLFNGAVTAHRPLTQSADDDPEDINMRMQESVDLISLIIGSGHLGLLATSPVRDKRTGIEYIGLVTIHPDDREEALLSGAGRKVPVALLLTRDQMDHMEPVKPRKKGTPS